MRTIRGILAAARGPLVTGTDPPLTAANLPPTHARLEIVRDRHGVPHIYAEDERDLFSALGYLQGADRFVLLDALRHLGAGRITELIGELGAPRWLDVIGGRHVSDIDAFIRPLGFEADSREAFHRLGSDAKDRLRHFAAGLNAALAAMQGVFPPEYLLFGAVRPWQPWDCLLTARTCAFFVSLTGLDHELTFDAVRNAVGDRVARVLYPDVEWDDAPDERVAAPSSRKVSMTGPNIPVSPPGGGSNNWVVGSERTVHGKPLVANDPHVPVIPLPTFWYHAHLECPRFRVQGGMLPGCPAFGFGHNGSLAWGVTTGYRDGWDLYRVHRLPDDPSRYRTSTGEAAITRHRETLYGRWGRSTTIEWESCEHGILYPGWKHHDRVDLAVRFVSADLATYFEGCLELMAADTVAAHQAAVAKLNEGPFDFNHTYGHKDGHFGWEIYGRLPRRSKDGLFVRDAHDPNSAWNGFVSFDEMPKILNPASGYVATANSYTDDGNYRAVATRSHYEPRLRQDRIEQHLSADSRHSIDTLAAIQADVGSVYAWPLRDALTSLIPRSPETPYAAAYEQLSQWNGEFDCDSAGAAIFVWTMIELSERAFGALLGHELALRFCNGRKARPRLHQLLLDPGDPLIGEIERAAGLSLSALAEAAFRAALKRVARACGDDPQRWRWGEVQRAWLAAPLAVLPGIGRYFVALDGGFPGDDYTVNPSRSIPIGARLYSFVGASSRFLCDLSNPDEAWFAHSSGPSGDAFSPFFANLSRDWLEFRYFRSCLWRAGDVPDVVERLIIEAHAPASEGRAHVSSRP